MSHYAVSVSSLVSWLLVYTLALIDWYLQKTACFADPRPVGSSGNSMFCGPETGGTFGKQHVLWTLDRWDLREIACFVNPRQVEPSGNSVFYGPKTGQSRATVIQSKLQ
jgi:hypothetical protein